MFFFNLKSSQTSQLACFEYPCYGSTAIVNLINFSEEIDFNPFKPEFIIIIFIHYKPRIAVTILDL